MSKQDGEIALETGVARYRVVDPHTRSGSTIMLLAGLGAHACDTPMLSPLIDALAHAGHRSVMVDWHGPRGARTVASDVEAVLAVHEALVESRAIDSANVVLFGHSIGALVAALAASVASFAGVVVYGAAARRFADALEVGTSRQLPLRGFTREAAEQETRLSGRLYRAVLRGGLACEALPRELLASVAAGDLRGDALFGQPIEYLRSIDAIEPEAVIRRVACPLHAIQGGFDWVVGDGDAHAIAAWSRLGTALSIAKADHYLGSHVDLESSMRERGRGAPSGEAVAAVVASCEVLLNHAGVTRT